MDNLIDINKINTYVNRRLGEAIKEWRIEFTIEQFIDTIMEHLEECFINLSEDYHLIQDEVNKKAYLITSTLYYYQITVEDNSLKKIDLMVNSGV